MANYNVWPFCAIFFFFFLPNLEKSSSVPNMEKLGLFYFRLEIRPIFFFYRINSGREKQGKKGKAEVEGKETEA
jgi:hypothetical protein